MKRFSRMMWLVGLIALGLAGCTPTTQTTSEANSTNQIIRVRLLSGVTQVFVSATANPRLSIGDDSTQREVIFPRAGEIAVARTPGGWRIGAAPVDGEILTLWPGPGGTLSVNESAYRGSIRLVPTEGGTFDVINDAEIDDYLKGVLSAELFRPWHIEAYKAQAVVARTYALYQSHTEGLGRYWDVYSDVRSQAYGGIAAETDKSRQAADETAGLVLTYGSGDGKIFPAFFSSDSGGVTQSAADAFGGPDIPPLNAHEEIDCGKLSPHHNWGPIAITKEEFTRRLRTWAARKSPPRPEAAIGIVANVQVVAVNSFGRPRAFKVTDANGLAYILAAEELRTAYNTDAPAGQTLPSSFCKAGAAPNQDALVFFEGHGYGHGVGLSQWSAQEHALQGQSYEQILLASYPEAKLAKAY